MQGVLCPACDLITLPVDPCVHCKAQLCSDCMKKEGHTDEFDCGVCGIRKCHYDLPLPPHGDGKTCYRCFTVNQLRELAATRKAGRDILGLAGQLAAFQITLGK